ncbi:MAG: hypothetical protein ACJAWS_000518 [Oleiphilaceae bacterium]|jgi:hypothetical protein
MYSNHKNHVKYRNRIEESSEQIRDEKSNLAPYPVPGHSS